MYYKQGGNEKKCRERSAVCRQESKVWQQQLTSGRDWQHSPHFPLHTTVLPTRRLVKRRVHTHYTNCYTSVVCGQTTFRTCTSTECGVRVFKCDSFALSHGFRLWDNNRHLIIPLIYSITQSYVSPETCVWNKTNLPTKLKSELLKSVVVFNSV